MNFDEYPFLSLIKIQKNEYVGIIQHTDKNFISFYDYHNLTNQQDKIQFLKLGEEWWWESNRTIPINLFFNRDFEIFKKYIKSFTTKDVEIVFGPATSLNNVQKKRIIRRNISLVKKTNS